MSKRVAQKSMEKTQSLAFLSSKTLPKQCILTSDKAFDDTFLRHKYKRMKNNIAHQ
jgi:hypothetical protein